MTKQRASQEAPIVALPTPVAIPQSNQDLFGVVPVPTADERAAALDAGQFGSRLGAAVAMTLESTIAADPIIKAANDVASTVHVSDALEQQILYYSTRTLELSKGQFDFGVNYRFESPRSDLSKAAEGVLSVQGHRDRLCYIEIELRQAKKKLDSAYDTGVAYLFEVYSKKMESYNRDAFARGLFLNKIFKPLEENRKAVKALLEQIECALTNLDKAHYAYKAVVDVGRTILERVEGRAG